MSKKYGEIEGKKKSLAAEIIDIEKDKIKMLEETLKYVLSIKSEKIQQLESRIKELESEKTTELITEKEDYYGAMTNITKTKCCGIAPITNENFCPNCGRKILSK